MKTKKVIQKLTYACACVVFILFSGCKKDAVDQVTPEDMDFQAEDFELEEQIGNDADKMADEAYTNGNSSSRLSPSSPVNSVLSCAVVTNDTVSHLLTIDFGSGCTGPDGRTRRGQILIQYNGHYFDPGFSRTGSFNNYFVDSNAVSGTRSITNNGFNGNGNLNWTIQAQNMRVTRPNGYYNQRNSTRNREMIAGLATTGDPTDDIYLITGSGTCINSNGKSATLTITNPLRKELSCRWIVSGTVVITPLNHAARTLDYGQGSCDHFATVTRNGTSRVIVLH